VRHNKATYEGSKFTQAGIQHHDIFYTDGSCPDDAKIQEFLSVAEKGEPIAIHCKAGLGRTGTMIGLYVMKHFKMPAPAFIGWIRICRPGSILGAQQQFLNRVQNQYFEMGTDSAIYDSLDSDMKELIEKFKVLRFLSRPSTSVKIKHS